MDDGVATATTSGFGASSALRRYTGVDPEPTRPAPSWTDKVLRMARAARSLFALSSIAKSFNWDDRATLPVPGAQGHVNACVSYAGCLAAAIRYQIGSGRTILLAPRVFHFCTLKLEAEQGTNSYDLGDRAIASGIPHALTASQAMQGESLLAKASCSAFDTWPRLRIDGVDRFESVEAVKREISTVGPVIAHIALYQGFLDAYVQNTIFRPPSGTSPIGKHAICLIGYDDDRKCWIGINSGGPGWGRMGRFLLQYDTCDVLGPDMPVYAPRLRA